MSVVVRISEGAFDDKAKIASLKAQNARLRMAAMSRRRSLFSRPRGFAHQWSSGRAEEEEKEEHAARGEER